MGKQSRKERLGKRLPDREPDEKWYVYILLMRYPDNFSRAVRFFTRMRYSHASVGLGGANGTFYSYVIKGFRRELPEKHPTFRQAEVPCRLYKLAVSEKIYEAVKTALAEHEKQATRYRYTVFGMILSLLRITYKRKNRYFCSQFVSEMLEKAQAVPLHKPSARYLPDDFMKMAELELCFTGNMSEMVKG